MNRKISTVMLSACLLGLVSCSNPADTDPEGVVSKKAKLRWKDRVSQKNEKLFSYLAPSIKTLTTEKAYLGKFGSLLTYKEAVVKGVNCDKLEENKAPNICYATVDVTYEFYNQYSGVNVNTRTMTEKWVKEDGDWWIYDR